MTLCSVIAKSATQFKATLLISGDKRMGTGAGIGGVHVPGRLDPADFLALLGPEKLVGYSAHSLADIRYAEARSADYVTLSPIFPSKSKPGYGPQIGLNCLRSIAQSTNLPVIALGGVSIENARECLEAGAAGIAVMGDVMRADDPAALFRALNEQVRGG